MKYFYYLKTLNEEVVYQDEEIVASKEEKEAILARIASDEEVTPTKVELQTEIESHKIEVYNSKTDTKITIDAKDAICLIRWDGRSPYYELVKGMEPTDIPFSGWPQVSKDNYVEPVEELVTE